MGQEKSDYFLKMLEIFQKRKLVEKAQVHVRFSKELRADFQTLEGWRLSQPCT